VTQDIKGLIERWRSGDKPGNPNGCYGLQRIEVGTELANALESLLSRQPVEVEGVGWVQVVPVKLSEEMWRAGYECLSMDDWPDDWHADGTTPEAYMVRIVWPRLLTASAKEGEKNG